MSKTTNKLSPEVRERAVRLVLDNQGQPRHVLACPPSNLSRITGSANLLNATNSIIHSLIRAGHPRLERNGTITGKGKPQGKPPARTRSENLVSA
jgi:hypothetical protein